MNSICKARPPIIKTQTKREKKKKKKRERTIKVLDQNRNILNHRFNACGCRVTKSILFVPLGDV